MVARLSAFPPAPDPHESYASGADSSIFVEERSDDQWVVHLAGSLPIRWADYVLTALSIESISVVDGEAEKKDGRWTVRLGVRALDRPPSASLVLDALDNPRASYPPPCVLDQFFLDTDPSHGGTTRLELVAKDRIGFLAAILAELASLALFPVKFRITTELGYVRDQFWLKTLGGREPGYELLAALRRRCTSLLTTG